MVLSGENTQKMFVVKGGKWFIMEGIDQQWLSSPGTGPSDSTYTGQFLMKKEQKQIIENNFRKKHEINLLLLIF